MTITFKQIVCGTSGADGETSYDLYGLDENGCVWVEYKGAWKPIRMNTNNNEPHPDEPEDK